MGRRKRYPSKQKRDETRRGQARASIDRADDIWLAEGGLARPHTVIGVATARRLLARGCEPKDALRAYVQSAPKRPPTSDYVAEHGETGLKPKKSPPGKTLVRRVVSGGAPSLGKRR